MKFRLASSGWVFIKNMKYVSPHTKKTNMTKDQGTEGPQS